jgi:hypothetical protein
MKIRSMLAGGTVLAGLLVSVATQAAVLTGSAAAWITAVGGNYTNTTNTGIPDGNTITSVLLADGTTLGLANSNDLLLHAGQPDYIFNLTDGYTGDVVDTNTTNTETISIPGGMSALGMEILPDIPFVSDSNITETITATLSDGTSQQFVDTYDYSGGILVGGTEQTQFVGFYGGGETSMTITMTDGLPINPQTNQQAFGFGNFVDVPEPMSLSLLLSGLVGLPFARARARS